MVFSWLKRRRRRGLAGQPLPSTWEETLRTLPFFRTLHAEEQSHLREFIRAFVEDKYWEGCGGFKMIDEVRVSIAAQAGLLVLNLHHSYYRRVRSILVYPYTYVDEHGTKLGGQAMRGGPIALAWSQVVMGSTHPHDGHNVVFHEFAHKLDMLDDFADGAPPLQSKELEREWNEVRDREFESLVRKIERRKRTFLDSYAATDHVEFFAVATESFFERPLMLRKRHQRLYELMAAFYRQDPAARPGARR